VTFESGTVFRWDEFPDPRYDKKNIKARWFIYLGDSGAFSQVLLAYICTTTTQKSRSLQINGINYSHHLIELKSNNSPFEYDCVLDCDEPPYPKEKKLLENHPNIEIKGKLDEQKLREIYNGIYKSNAYSPMTIHDIHNSFNNAGIFGLKKPKV
jgi:hypothetical protein